MMAKRIAKKKAPPPMANDNEATMVVTLYDGTRQPIQEGGFLIRILDGFQNMLFADYKTAPTTMFRLPYRDNLQDNCTVLATGSGHVDAGFTPASELPREMKLATVLSASFRDRAASRGIGRTGCPQGQRGRLRPES
jgi:hypothetical protein